MKEAESQRTAAARRAAAAATAPSTSAARTKRRRASDVTPSPPTKHAAGSDSKAAESNGRRRSAATPRRRLFGRNNRAVTPLPQSLADDTATSTAGDAVTAASASASHASTNGTLAAPSPVAARNSTAGRIGTTVSVSPQHATARSALSASADMDVSMTAASTAAAPVYRTSWNDEEHLPAADISIATYVPVQLYAGITRTKGNRRCVCTPPPLSGWCLIIVSVCVALA